MKTSTIVAAFLTLSLIPAFSQAANNCIIRQINYEPIPSHHILILPNGQCTPETKEILVTIVQGFPQALDALAKLKEVGLCQ